MVEKVLVDKSNLTEMADKLREVNGTTGSISVDELTDGVVNGLGSGGEPVLQEKTVIPSTTKQEVTADNNYDGLSKVTVEAIDPTDLTPDLFNVGSASDLLYGKQLIDESLNKVTGTMPNNGTINKTMDGIDVKSVTVPAGYTSGGTVALDGTIDGIADDQAGLIAQIQTALEGKAAGGGTGGSSGGRIATGTFTPGTNAATATVTGLPFKPSFVEIMAAYDAGSTPLSSNTIYLVGLKKGVIAGTAIDTWVYLMSSVVYGPGYTMAAASLAFKDDGFKVNARAGTRTAYLVPVTYSYIAIE